MAIESRDSSSFRNVILIFSVPALSIALIIAVIIGELDRRRLVDFTIKSLHYEVRSQAAHVHRFLYERVTILRTLASLPEARSGKVDAVMPLLDEQSARLSDVFESLYFNDLQGDVYGTDHQHFNVKDRYYYPDIEQGKEIITHPITSRASGRKIMLLVVPVVDSGGERIGAIAGTVLIEQLIGAIEQLQYGSSGKFALFAGQEVVASGARPETFDAMLTANNIEAAKTSIARFAVDGTNYVFAVESVGPGDWSLGIIQDFDIAFAGAPQFRVLSLAILIGTALLVVTVLSGRAHRELLNRDEQLHIILDSTTDGVWIVEVKTGEVRWSDRLYEIAGVQVGSVSPSIEYILENTHPADRERLAASIQRHLETGGHYEIEHRYRVGNRDYRWLLVKGGTRLGRDGRPTEVLGTVTDITERKDHERELQDALRQAREADSAKGRFLAQMSHELRTPLNGVVGFSDLLEREDLSERQRALLDHMRSSVETLRSLVDDLLDASAIDSGRFAMRPEKVAVRSILHRCLEQAKNNCAAKGLHFVADIASTVSGCYVLDPHRFSQLVGNVLNNAIKFTDEGGRIEFRASAHLAAGESDRFEFEIEDTGIGVPTENRDEIFSYFSRVDSRAGQNSGLGLGLAICRRIAEEMQGSITLERSSPEGSLFRIEVQLPRASATAEAGLAGREEAEAALPSYRILLVEDEATNQLVGKRLLESLGQHCSLAADGMQALQYLEQGTYDIVFMDVRMPVLDGLETMRRIRSAEAETGERLYIVALTAHAYREDEIECKKAGADDFMAKPVSRNALLAAIKKYTEFRRAAAA